MVLIKDIISYLDQLIDNAKSTTIFTQKCGMVASILSDMKNEIANSQTIDESKQKELTTLQSHIEKLYSIIDSFQREQCFWLFVNTNVSLKEIISHFNDAMTQINQSLQDIGVNKDFRVPTIDLYDDIREIDELLSDTFASIQERIDEVREYLKQIQKAKSNINIISTDDDIFEEINKRPQYKLKKSDFTINPEEIDHNNEFFYYKGYKNSNKQNVTVLKLINNRIFKRLISVLVTIDHPYVESFIGSYLEDNQITIVTNRDGVRLTNLLSSHKESDNISLDPGDRTILAFKIAQAMSYLHSQSVIHRNLCTSHVFITKPLNEEKVPEIQPLIVGFRDSLIQQNDSSMKADSFNRSKLSFFKAPELEESESFDEKVDVFAFSGILFEMLTGQRPFRNKNSSQVSDLLKRNMRPELPESTPEELRKLIEKCWSSDPEERYTFDQIVDKMIKKKIIFQDDKEKQELIEKFYEKNEVKSTAAKKCLDAFETIKKFIGKTYQYQLEFLRIRPILYKYQNQLKTSEFSTKDELTDSEAEAMEKLSKSLKLLSLTIINQSEAKWSEMLQNSRKASFLLSHFNITETTAVISNTMNEIYQSLIDLGFINVDKYVEIDDDLVFDYNDLQNTLEDYRETIDSEIIESKLNEINKFRKERKLDGTITKESLHRRIKDMFAPFKEDFSVSRTDNTDKKYVSKLNENDFNSSDTYLYILSKQIRYLSRLNHKYINKFIGFNVSDKDNSVWFVSEFVPDGSLFHSVVTENKLSASDKTKIAFKIAEAMCYMNSQKIIHLDLNSSNILINKNEPKLINFNFKSKKKKCEVRNSPYSLGTLNYMAPELIKCGKYDSRADVFSFAMILYEMYSGKKPFYQFGDNYDIIKKKLLGGVKLKFGNDIQQALKHLIEECSQLNYENRPSFKDIINRMRNDNILFPGANEDHIKTFYEDESKKMNLDTQS